MSDDTAAGALFGVDDVAGGKIGATEAAVRKSLTDAALDTRDHGAGELAAQCARAVDVAANVRRDPYGVAAAARELREQLIRLRLDPVARLGNDAGQLQTFLDSLQHPDQVVDDQAGSG